MIKNAYILHIDDPRSIKYLNDCLESCKLYSDINPIPVQGYNGANVSDICEEFGIDIIPYYVDQMDTIGDTLSKAFSCTAGHIKIWQMIADSGEPGAVLEHDAIIKGPLSNIDVDDDVILWLGPRIDQEQDYRYPWGAIPQYTEVDRWEGTHAYCITPKTARRLLESIKHYGLNDSIDGQLGMRNIFDIAFAAVDPPPVVAIVGNRQSCIESHGNPGFWNAWYGEQFLKNTRQGCNLPPIRKLHYTDTSFNQRIRFIERALGVANKLDSREQSVLVLGGHEGLSSVWLSNKLLQHDNSYMQIISNFKGNEQQICQFNTYFSKYYYKLNTVPVPVNSDILIQAEQDPDIHFDIIFWDGEQSHQEVLHDGILLWNLLKKDGILIFNNCDDDKVRTAVKNIIKAVDPVANAVIYSDEAIAIQKV